MNTQELTIAIEKLKSNIIKEEAYLGFFQFGGGQDESFIKANKEGLICFAIELLEGSLSVSNKEENKIFSLSNDWLSENSDFYFSYIEMFKKGKEEIEPILQYEETWKDKLIGYFLIGILIFILISILVGAITIISWLF